MRALTSSLTTIIVGLALTAGTIVSPSFAAGETVTINASTTSLSGSSLSGFDSGKTLYLLLTTSAGTMTWTDSGSGTASVSGSTARVKTLWLSGTQSSLNSALQNEIAINGPCSGVVNISASVSEYRVLRNPSNGHLYSITDSAYDFEAGVTYAESLPLVENGTDTFGYLATITSDEENFLIGNGLGYGNWVGATDSAVEGEWRWVTGPEAGQLFFDESTRTTPPGAYSIWGDGEPNNAGNEDYLEVRPDLKWNDIGQGGRRLIIEWGGMPGDDLSSVTFFEGSDSVTILSAIDGQGTEDQPYLVSNQAELEAVESCAARGIYFEQDQDITVSNFPGIGSESTPFVGIFDGADHSITETGLTVLGSRRGLFNVIGSWDIDRYETTLRNITLNSSATITDSWGIGLLVGQANHSELRNILVNGDITITNSNSVGSLVGHSEDSVYVDVTSNVDFRNLGYASNIGGLIGEGYSSYVENAKTTGDIVFENSDYNASNIGGLLGYHQGGETYNSSSTGQILANAGIYGSNWGGLSGIVWSVELYQSEATGTVHAPDVDKVGGLFGSLYYSDVYITRSSGSVTGNTYVGGLVGYQEEANISDSVSSGSVTANNSGGALVGETDCANVYRSYAYGRVTAETSRGLIGNGCGSVQDSYWIQNLVGIVDDGNAVDGEKSITSAEAQDIETFNDWNIADYLDQSSTWVICESFNSGLPTLQFFGADGCLLKNNDTAAPTILGSGAPNSALTIEIGPWDGEVDFTYAWYADEELIVGAVENTFVPGMSYLDKEITLEVTGVKTGYRAVTRSSSNAIVISIPSLTNKTEPLIVGTGKAGEQLTINKGNWDAGVTFTYVWKADGQAITGANSASFTPGEDLEGKQITLDITGTKVGYRTVTLNSGNSVTVSVDAVVTPSVKRTVTKAFAGFTAHSWKVSSSLKAKIKAFTKSHSSATSVFCTGIVKYDSGFSSQSGVGFNRAKAACAEILKLKPGIKVAYAWKYAGKRDTVQRGVAIRFNK